MVVGILVVGLYMSQSGSLKGKRRIVQSLKTRVRNKFNVAVAEVGEDLDLWQRATLGIATVANDKQFVHAVLDQVMNTIGSSPGVEVIQREIQFV